MRRFDREERDFRNDRSPRPPPGPPPQFRSNKRARDSSSPISNKRARQDGLPKAKDIEEGIKIVDESVEHVSSRLKALRGELENIRNQVLNERIESLKSNKSFSTERFATERRRLESMSLNQLLRLERKDMSERVSKDEQPALLNSLNANGSPVLAPRHSTISVPSSPRPSPKEMLLSPDISLDAIFPPMPKPWKMKVDTKMLRKITEANRKLVGKKQKQATTEMKNVFEKVTNDVRTSFEKSRDRMLRVLKQRKVKWHSKEMRFAKMYVQKTKLWKANIKAWEMKREKDSAGLSWTSRSRTVTGSSNKLLQGASGNFSPRHTEEKTKDSGQNKKSGKYLTRADVVRSEYEQQRLLDEMTQMEKQKTRYLKTVASVVPYVACHRDRHYAARKEDKNSLYDPMKSHEQHKLRKVWSDTERLIFIDKFLQYPKDFHRISAFLANKNTRDCVAYYYASKKSIPYKHLLAEQLQRRRGKMSWYVMKETLKVLNMPNVSEDDLGAQCTNAEYLEACLVAAGELEVNSNESDAESDSEGAGFTSIQDKANFLSKILRINDNLHTIDADELRRHPATFIEDMILAKKKKADAEKESTHKSNSSASNGSDRSAKSTNDKPSARSNKWTPEEKEMYLKQLKVSGKDWTSIHKKVPTKTIAQIKNFYQNYKNKLQLDKIVSGVMKKKEKKK